MGNGLTQAFTYDTDYRVTRVQVGNAAQGVGAWLDRSLTWTGDMATAIADNQFPGNTTPFTYAQQSQTFTYTAKRRLATAKGYYGTISWLYDANGNRTRETLNGVVSTYTYPTTSNKLTKVTPTGGTARNFTYDAAGNTATDSRTGALGLTSEYDVEGRLSKVYQTNNSAEGATYAYDARGRLSARTVTHASAPTSTTTVYVHDLNDHIIAELNASGQTLREYIWLDDMPVAVVDNVASGNPVIYYVHVDHLMRPARMTAQDTSWVWDVIYAPFGGVSYIWSNPANIDLRFPGQWFQLESGLAYNWHRHYDATLGRYVQPDPLRVDDAEGATVGGITKAPPQQRSSILERISSLAGSRFNERGVQSSNRAVYPDGPSIYGYVSQSPLAYLDPEGLVEIKGYSGHALGRMQLRGITPGAVVDACQNPLKSFLQPNGNTCYVGTSCTVILSPDGWVVTVY